MVIIRSAGAILSLIRIGNHPRAAREVRVPGVRRRASQRSPRIRYSTSRTERSSGPDDRSLDTGEVEIDELPGGVAAGLHPLLKLFDRRFIQRKGGRRGLCDCGHGQHREQARYDSAAHGAEPSTSGTVVPSFPMPTDDPLSRATCAPPVWSGTRGRRHRRARRRNTRGRPDGLDHQVEVEARDLDVEARAPPRSRESLEQSPP